MYVTGFVANYLTILNNLTSPNTDGIDPDSTQDVLITNCYIHTGARGLGCAACDHPLRASSASLLTRPNAVSPGDDCIAIKSGWDQYGYDYGIPSRNITIRNCSFTSPTSAGVCVGGAHRHTPGLGQ